MRALLVEDYGVIADVLEQGLKDAAYAVDRVTNGQAAIDAFAVRAYDLVLLDLGLPKKKI